MTTAFVHYNTIVLYHRCSCPIFSDLTEDYNSITIRVNHLYNMLCGSDTLKFVLIIDFCTKSETPTMPFPTHRSTFNSVQSAVVYHPHIVNYGMHQFTSISQLWYRSFFRFSLFIELWRIVRTTAFPFCISMVFDRITMLPAFSFSTPYSSSFSWPCFLSRSLRI